MPFPLTVDSASLTPESPGRNGPFRNGTDRYIINCTAPDPDTLEQFLTAWKSTDNGVTWTEQDAANRPSTIQQLYSCCQSSSTIFIVYADVSTVGFNITTFDPSTDTWGLAPVSTTPDFTLPVTGISTVYRSADNSVVLILPGGLTGTDVVHFLTSFAVFDATGQTWSAWSNMDFQDYTNPVGTLTEWNQFPCGACLDSDGNVRVFMAQMTRLGADPPVPIQLPFASDDTFTVPGDCTAITAEVVGGGGGGGAIGPGGGGGGGGYDAATDVAVTPGDMVAITVGAAGVAGGDGGDSSCLGASATGGQGGGQGSQDAPGAGGTGSANGGNGGTAFLAGGGGGACGNATGAGGNGGDGNNPPFGGGEGGIPAGFPSGPGPFGFGGNGGNTAIPPVTGINGQEPGGGGGGSGLGTTPGTSLGASGIVLLSYIQNRGSQAGRLWQQAILPDNSLGTLDLMTFAIPALNAGSTAIPLSFDCKAGDGFVAVAVTGVTGVGNDQIAIGQGTNADPIGFDFDLFDNGNAGSGRDCSPALAVNFSNDDVYCVYKSVPDDSSVVFRYILNGGSPVLIGAFNDAGCRIQAEVFSGVLQIAFGTPTVATGSLNVDT
jgi:hypothetical protein